MKERDLTSRITVIKKQISNILGKDVSAIQIEENLEVEIMDICFNEARELGHKVKIVNN